MQCADANVSFDDSAVVLLNNKGEMLGTRITGPVSASLRLVPGDASQPGGKWAKLLSVAPKVSCIRQVDLIADFVTRLSNIVIIVQHMHPIVLLGTPLLLNLS